MKNLFSKLFFGFFFFCVVALGQNPAIQKYDAQSGPSSNYIRTIYKDTKGLLWIGTDNGLDSYDGLQFVNYGKRFKIPLNGTVQSIIEIKDGTFIIGTSWGAYIYSVTGNQITPIDFGLQTLDVKQVYKTAEGKLFFISDKGVYQRSSQRKAKLLTPELKNMSVIGMTEDNKHNLWLISRNGIYQIDSHEHLKPAISSTALSDRNIISFLYTGKGDFLLGTDKGLMKLEISTQKLSEINGFSSYTINSLVYDKNDNIYIGTEFDGLIIYNQRNGQTRIISNNGMPTESLSSSSIKSLNLDNSGILWIGTFTGGLNKLRLQNNLLFRNVEIPNIKENHIRSLYISPMGEKFIGTNLGIFCLDPQNKVIAQYNGKYLRSKILTTIYPYPGNADLLLIGTFGGGVSILNKKSGTFSNLSDKSTFTQGSVYRFCKDNRNNLWIATLDGVFKYDLSHKRFIQYNMNKLLGNNEIFSLETDKSGRVWIGTKSGVCYYSATDHKFHIPSVAAGYHFLCTYIFSDNRDNIWFCFNKGGVLKLDKYLNKKAWITTEIGLPENSPASVINDKTGNIWISTLKGLFYIDNNHQIRRYDLEDGLSGTGFCPGVASVDQNGSLWWSNEKGLVSYNPARNSGKKNFNLLFTGLKINGTQYDIDTLLFVHKESINHYRIQIRGKHNNNLEFLTSALNYEHPQKNSYSYQLNGNGLHINTTSKNNVASFNDLSIGTYNLFVNATDRDGNSAKQPLEISFSIVPYFYETTWFILTIIIIIGGCILYFTRTYIFRMKDKIMNQLEESKKRQNPGSGIQRVSEEKGELIKEKLLQYMQEEKPFLNPGLRQSDVAKATGYSIHEISEVINNQLNLNFADFINSFRIEEIKRRVESGYDKKYTLSSIALQCGFNASSSFLRAFKKATGVTPTQYFKSSVNEEGVQ